MIERAKNDKQGTEVIMNRTAEGKSRTIRYGRVVRETGTEESPNTSLSVTDTQRATVREDCPACQDDLVIEDNERYCSACGLVVVENRIDHGPEWQPFVDDSSGKCRVGSPLTAARHDYRWSRRNTTSFTALTRAKLSFAHQKSPISEDVDTHRHLVEETTVYARVLSSPR